MEKVFLSILAGPAEPGLIHVVHATLNFIYYMHFESHTLDSLLKLPSMYHYIDSIISRGSADGFITESPECMHINFAKNTYQATNKRNYIKQMKKWLEHQDACFQFSTYLQWTLEGYNSKLEGSLKVKENNEDGDMWDYEEGDEDVGERAVFLATL